MLGFWGRFEAFSTKYSDMDDDTVHGISWRQIPPNTIGGASDLMKTMSPSNPVANTEKGLEEEDELVSRKKQILGSAVVTWLNFIVGYSTGYVSPAISSMNGSGSKFRVSENEISWIGSLMPLFALVGSSLGGFTLDRYGRKWTIILGGIPFLPSFALTYVANKVWMVMVGRGLSGLAIGITTVSVPVYLGELTGPKVRGFYGLLPTTSGNLGILVATLLGLQYDWRTMAFLGVIFTVPFFFIIYFLEETPSWKKENEIRKLDKILKPITDLSGWRAERRTCGDTARFYSRREYLLPFSICLGMHVVQQFCGINAVITYATQIFQGVNSSVEPEKSTVIVSLVNVFSTLLATFLVDKLGRKKLMYISLLMLTFANLTLSAYYYSSEHGYTWVDKLGWLPLVTLAVFILGFSLGAGPIPWLIIGEVLPAKIRGAAASIVTAAHWVFTFVVTKTFVDVSETFGPHLPFAGYAIICVLGLFLMNIVPETAGKTLQEIQNRMQQKKKEKKIVCTISDTKVPPKVP